MSQSDDGPLDKETLERARDVGTITTASAHIRLMARGIAPDGPEPTTQDIRAGVLGYVEPMNAALRIGWAVWMGDKAFAQRAIDELQSFVDDIKPIQR